MNDDTWFGIHMGILLGIAISALVGAVIAVTSTSTYARCSPDEVWAWQMGYRPDAENREWECVAISDLITEVE